MRAFRHFTDREHSPRKKRATKRRFARSAKRTYQYRHTHSFGRNEIFPCFGTALQGSVCGNGRYEKIRERACANLHDRSARLGCRST